MLVKDDNVLDSFIHHNKKKYSLGNDGQNVEEDQKNLIGKSLDNKSIKNILFERISQDGLFANKSSFLLREIWFSKQEFFASTLVSDIKYNYPRSQNNNIFYVFNN